MCNTHVSMFYVWLCYIYYAQLTSSTFFSSIMKMFLTEFCSSLLTPFPCSLIFDSIQNKPFFPLAEGCSSQCDTPCVCHAHFSCSFLILPRCSQGKPSQSNPESTYWKQIRLLRNCKDKLKPTKSRKKRVHMLFSSTHHSLLSVLSLSHYTSTELSLWSSASRTDTQKCGNPKNLAGFSIQYLPCFLLFIIPPHLKRAKKN